MKRRPYILTLALHIALWIVPAWLLFVLSNPWPDTPDGLFHLHRTRALAEALTWGIPYPRWFPDFAFGYGYPVLNFYAPAGYYPPALLALGGLDLITATRVALALAYALSGWAAYRLLRLWSRPWAALVGAALYLFYPYHLYDLFVRGALPEFDAFLWLPLILWATHALYTASAQQPFSLQRHLLPFRHHPERVFLAALAWGGLILTHNLTALMAALALVIYVLVCALLNLLRRAWKNFPHLSLALWPLVGAALITAFYTLPALWELPYVGLGASPESEGFVRHFASLPTLFTWTFPYRYPDAAYPTVPVPAYALLILLGGLAVLSARHSRYPRVLAWGVAAALLTLGLTTDASGLLWHLFRPVLAKLQFPWRWQAPFSLALALVLALSLDALSLQRARTRGVLALVFALSLAAYALLGLHPTPAPYTAAELTPEQMWTFDREHGQVGASWTGEFLPRWVTEQRWAIGRDPADPNPLPTATAPDVHLSAWGYLSVRGHVRADAPTQVTFHTFYYPAWRVLLDGRVRPTRPATNLGLLTVDIPAGEHTLVLRWGDTTATRLGRALSLLGLGLFLVAFLLWGRGRLGRGLALVCALLLLGALVPRLLLPDGIIRPVRPVQARYPAVTLTGEDTVPTLARDTLRVRLFWVARDRGTPLTAFVHLVDGDGRVVAQHDGSIGATITPPSRWFPGLFIPDDHPIPLDNVPAGTYHVRVGVYRPGQAAIPLPAQGKTDGIVDLGEITISTGNGQ